MKNVWPSIISYNKTQQFDFALRQMLRSLDRSDSSKSLLGDHSLAKISCDGSFGTLFINQYIGSLKLNALV